MSVPAELASRIKPVSMAGEQLLPVLPALSPLLPAGGLRRGSVVTVAGSSSLALALAAGPSAAGSWCAAVGRPALGMVAAAELGVVLERFPSVPAPAAGAGPGSWAWVVAALVDAFEVVVAWPPSRTSVRAGDARRLVVRARERSAVLVVAVAEDGTGLVSPGWPEAPDVRLKVARREWFGLGEGHGRLRARRVEVVAGGRGSAARERMVPLWLPGLDGEIASAAAAEAEVDGVPVLPASAVLASTVSAVSAVG